MDACTIIAKNYLAHARTLAASYVEHHPDATFYVLIIDDIQGYVDAEAEPFELVTPAELNIPDFDRMAVIYDVLELSTAVKPWLLRWLLARSTEGALYLDPDMRLYAPLDNVFDAVREHKLVLSPHNIEPMPRDGRRPNEQDILIAGVYNLGFIGIGSGEFADLLLNWWGERLERDCIVDPERGFFVDQRWIDLVPSLTESFHLLRDAGFNVAYWNLATRPVSFRDGHWYVKGDVPLRLFHYSGYDPHHPARMSKHQDRIDLTADPELRRLCDSYGQELIANGVDEVAELPYTYATTASGIPLNNAMRRIHRDLFTADFEESVFEPEGERAFLAVLNGPAEHGGDRGVTRYLGALHERRPDLRAAYPNLDRAADAQGFLDWVELFGRTEVPIPPVLLPEEVLEHTGAAQELFEAPGPLGVNVAGYLQSELGVGEVARQAIEALDDAGVANLPVSVHAPLSRQGHDFAHVEAYAESFPLNLICVNADMLPDFAGRVGTDFFNRRYSIGWWWWEVADFPERWLGSFRYVDEVWAGSAYVAETLAAVSPVPVMRIPTPVRVPITGTFTREELGLPDGFLFLFMYDFNSVFARKNPLGTLQAFLRAFPEPGRASLVLKSINAEHHPLEHEQLVAAAAGHEHVQLIDRYVTPTQKNQFVAASDAFVSLHRSEGFGFGMAEAMLLGKPVIATGYSGNLDFMTAENSYLVDHTLTPIGAGNDPYPAESHWAEPDLDHAARLMRDVVEHREEAARRGARAAEDVARTNSAAAAGAVMAKRLQKVHADLRLPKTQPAGLAARDRAGSAESLVRSGGTSVVHGRLASVPRKGVLRLMRPHTAFQRQVDDQLATGLRNAGDELVYLRERHEDMVQRQLAAQASTLRELRKVGERLERLESGRLSDRVTATDARIDDVAEQLRELRRVANLFDPSGVAPAEEPVVEAYPTAPAEPWSAPYTAAHARFVARELADATLTSAFREGGALPERFGYGFDERVVEFPWVASRPLSGRVLDAGSALNHAHVLRHVRPLMDDLHIVTLTPEEQSFPTLGISYLYSDLRDLPMRDGTYDRAVSISTFELIGLSNEYYGSDVQRAADPQAECLRALAELRRVLKPGGDLYLTVPIGNGERFEWVRALTVDELDELVEGFGATERTLTYFRHDGGWQRASREEVVDARYRDHFSAGPPAEDRVVAAEAVACVHLRR